MDGVGWFDFACLPAQADFKLRFFWATLGLVVALLGGAIAIKWLDRWRKSPGPETLSAGDQLSHFRELYSQGTISKEEFEQIRARLASELREEMNLGPTPELPVLFEASKEPNPKELTLPQPPSEDIKPG